MRCAELLNALWDFTEEIKKKDKHASVKYILINHYHFFELAKDPDALKWLFAEDGRMNFSGVPMIRTSEVEYVDFCR